MSLPDLLRLLAVPLLGWAALRDYRTRRVPAGTWYPLLALGAVLLAWDAALVLGDPFRTRLFLLRAGLSVGLLVPLAYAFRRLGGFGAADAKAFAVLAVLFPVYPTYALGPVVLPLERTPIGVFSLTVVTDGVLLGALYPVAVAARNALAGRFSPAMVVGRPVPWDELETTHGKLLETPDGFTLSGLDLDALRMYLRWRGLTLADVRGRADELRDPASLPAEPNPPTGGAVATDGGGDPWGATAFLEDVGGAYGTTPEGLRDGLDLLADAERVWVSPGIPFLVPLFLGLLVALVYGDLLYALLGIVGLA